jgi:hypothetical protein
MRHLRLIADNAKKVSKLINNVESKANVDDLGAILNHKYHIRGPFLIWLDDVSEHIKEDWKKYKKEGYKLMAADKIYGEVVNLTKKIN